MTMENFVFKKKFGQNFIYDGNLLSAIVSDAKITPQTEVLEIGPGEGTLTKKLCGAAKRVVAYEIDRQLQAPLGALQSEFSNLEVVFEDALKAPIEEIEKNFSGDYVVVANLLSRLKGKFVDGYGSKGSCPKVFGKAKLKGLWNSNGYDQLPGRC